MISLIQVIHFKDIDLPCYAAFCYVSESLHER